jgi:hypothetical protein
MSLEDSFPNLVSGGYEITSDLSLDYNCIAWAAGDISRWCHQIGDLRSPMCPGRETEPQHDGTADLRRAAATQAIGSSVMTIRLPTAWA